MASTYSDLKIELIGTGDQSGTWGDTANVNLGTAIEEAIAGRATADFTSDADLTISLTNTNATQVARHLILNVTSAFGSLTTTRNLIVPTIDKPYLIENNTTGAQSIVVKTSAGTGITVPNGKKMFVYANSTNVVDAISYLTAVTLGTALPVASGGTGLATLTANNVMLGNGTSAPGFVAPGTSGNILTSNGTTWTSAAGTTTPGDHEICVYIGNGYGSTNTKIRRFLTTKLSVGTDITYADSATLGATFTINTTGLYTIDRHDYLASSGIPCGISVNSTELTTGIASIAIANVVAAAITPPQAGGGTAAFSATTKFTAGDVIRCHDDAVFSGGANFFAVMMRIRKVGVI